MNSKMKKKTWIYAVSIILTAIISSYATVKFNKAEIKFYGPDGVIYEASVPTQVAPKVSFSVTYSDFLAITLTAMTVVIGVGAIVIALIAFRTIADIKRNAEKAAQDHVSKAVNTEIEGLSGKITSSIENNVNVILPSHISDKLASLLAEMQRNGELSTLMETTILRMSQMDAATADELSHED